MDKSVLVVGAGISGLSTARFLAKKGARPVLTDNKPADELKETVGDIEDWGVKLNLDSSPAISENHYDLVIVSPGVPLWAPPILKASKAGIPIMGEIELAWRFSKAPVIGITGTNGKTTTTTMVGEIFKQAGYNTYIAGNIGLPFIDVVDSSKHEDIIVLELSSFQLETITSFKPSVGAILNLTPDHLDRHGSLEEYLKAKSNIFAFQDSSDKLVLNYDDPLVKELQLQAQSEVIFFSRKHNLKKGVFVYFEQIVVCDDNNITSNIMPVSDLALPGEHNLENALAAIACGVSMGISHGVLAETMRSFPGVPHRLEMVGEIDGVSFVNDSKGTNPESSIKALEAYDKSIVLIAGGRNKGSDFSELAKKINKKVRVAVVLGECAGEIEKAIKKAGNTRVLKAGDMDEAVLLAREEALPGEIVLMSPACASWDMFKNFEERGDKFKEIVRSFRG